MKWFLVTFLLLSATCWGGSHSATLKNDWAGNISDTTWVDSTLWSTDTLGIGEDTTLFLQSLDTALNTVQTDIYGSYGATPLVGIGANGQFRAMFLQYPKSSPVNPTLNQQNIASIDLLKQTVIISDTAGVGTYGQTDYYSKHYFPNDNKNTASVPAFVDFYTNQSTWIAQWSNDTTASGPSSRAHSSFPLPTGKDPSDLHLLMGPLSAPPSDLLAGDKGWNFLRGAYSGEDTYLRMSFAPLDNTLNEVVMVHGPHSHYGTNAGQSTTITVRWEQINPSQILSLDSFDQTTLGGLYHAAVATDVNKRSLVVYSDATGKNLTLVAYDNDYSLGTVTRQGIYNLDESIDADSSKLIEKLSRNFNVRSLSANEFLLVYSKAGAIHARQISISSGTPVALTNQVVSAVGGACQFPDLSVNKNFVAITFFRTVAGSLRPEFTRFERSGNSLVLPPYTQAYQGSPLTFSTIQSNTLVSARDNAQSLHIPGRVSVAIDTLGNAVFGFNQERNARIVGYRDRKIYLDSADWSSLPFSLSSFPIVTGDSVQIISSSTDASTPSKVRLDFIRNDVNLGTSVGTKYDAMGTFRYALNMSRIDSFSAPKVTSTNIAWNIQPRKPAISYIRIGDASSPLQLFDSNTTYDVINRRDTVRLFCTAWDLDNPASLNYHIKTAFISLRNGIAQSYTFASNATIANTTNNSVFTFEVVIPPQNLEAEPLVLTLFTEDQLWESPRIPIKLRYRNLLPTETMRISWKTGTGEQKDSTVMSGNAVRVQMNDSALVTVELHDENDDTTHLEWSIHNSRGVTAMKYADVLQGNSAHIRIPWDRYDRDPKHIARSDSLKIIVDTLFMTFKDPDTSFTRQLLFIPNHWPMLDSVSIIGIEQQGVFKDTLMGRWRANDAKLPLLVVPATPIQLMHHTREIDAINADQYRYQWEILLQDPVQKQQWNTAIRSTSDTLIYAFPDNAVRQLTRIRATVSDLSGATRSDTINVVFPRVDTLGGWEVSLTYLQDSLHFVIGSERLTAKREVGIRNIGALDLEIVSVRTGHEQGEWLDYQLIWANLPIVQEDTHISRIATPIQIPSGYEIPIHFSVDVANMRGDRTIYDTLFIATNDALSPLIKIPLAVRWDDLPRMTIMTRPSTGNTAVAPIPITPYFETNRSVLFVFSEPVAAVAIPSKLQVYSRLDSSARNVPGITPMESAYPGQLDVRPYIFDGLPVLGLTDTVIFTPLYKTASDFFDTKPIPYNFVRNDIIGFHVSNAIVDSTGNPLDLRTNKIFLAPGTFDTIIEARIDTTALRVLQTWPVNGGVLNPDDPIRILFSKPLVQSIISGGDTIRTLDTQTLKGDSNQFVQMRARFAKRMLSDFRYIHLERGDSMLVIRPRYKFLSDDSVEVWLSPYLASPYGHTLDGNNDGSTKWLPDSADAYRFRFVLGPTEFYVFPNPFKASNPEHAQKGGITFKNLHQISGLKLDQDIDIRIYSVDGTLVFSTKRGGNSYLYKQGDDTPPLYEWSICNNHGYPVASGVYIYTISQGHRILKKNKLMVIR